MGLRRWIALVIFIIDFVSYTSIDFNVLDSSLFGACSAIGCARLTRAEGIKPTYYGACGVMVAYKSVELEERVQFSPSTLYKNLNMWKSGGNYNERI